MEYQVPVIVEPLDEGGYYAEYPILQGCHVEGKTYLQTLEYLEDVIRIHIEGRLKFGQPLPTELTQVHRPEHFVLQLPVTVSA